MAEVNSFKDPLYKGGVSKDNIATVTSSVADILNLESNAANQQAQSTASAYTAAGDLAEATAYTTAAGIAGGNAALEEQASQIKQIQQIRQIQTTLGQQQADIGGAGFAASGSALYLMRDSVAQGALTTALTSIQGNINAGGYLMQQEAAQAEASAATGASNAASALAKAAASAGALSTTYATNELTALVKSLGLPSSTSLADLITKTTTAANSASTGESDLAKTYTFSGVADGIDANGRKFKYVH